MFALGNDGDRLLDLKMSNTYMTKDGGSTWREISKGPHKWVHVNFGGLLLLAAEGVLTNEIKYSWDMGETWAKFKFSDSSVFVKSMDTDSKSGSLAATLQVETTDKTKPFSIVNINFAELLDRKCVDNDFVSWTPTHVNGETTCFFGQKRIFLTKSISSVCAISADFKMPPAKEICPCAKQDFECEFNFFRNDVGDCVLYGKDPKESEFCRRGKKYMGSSGYKKLSLSKCQGGKNFAEPVERECFSDVNGPGELSATAYMFNGRAQDFFYFRDSSVIILLDSSYRCYLSNDNGKSWRRILENAGPIRKIIMDPYIEGRAFFVTENGKLLWFTSNRAQSFASMSIPMSAMLDLAPIPLSLHRENKNWLIWIGSDSCNTQDCHTNSFFSWDEGHSWNPMIPYVRKCEWGNSKDFKPKFEKSVYCIGVMSGKGNQRLYTREFALLESDDPQTQNSFKERFNSAGFGIEDSYMFVSIKDPKNDILRKLQVSVDGSRWDEASFPDNIKPEGFTILDSNSGAAFVQAYQNLEMEYEFGNLFKSTSWKGKSFVELISRVNQDQDGFIDFERVALINGTLIINQVVEDQPNVGQRKKSLVTKISYDDGITWATLSPPKFDSQRKSYNCNSCSLHLHGYTSRHDKRDSYTSSSIPGLMIGVGNVGESLGHLYQSDTFLSVDAGRSWSEIAKGIHMFEIGDHGGIILLANDQESINSVKYSLNLGQTFQEYSFSDILEARKIRLEHIITQPSGTDSHFVLLGKMQNNDTSVAIYLDFSKVWSRQCKVSEDAVKNDFEEWTEVDACRFGKKVGISDVDDLFAEKGRKGV
jgi:hypothetical protein